ncbi:diaminopimelate epimerase [bacterium]|nr:diaminopimelate epimerase [bacterium]
MKFSKYHALGNDYVVLNPKEAGIHLTESQIKTICHRQYGIGSDGILLGPIASTLCDFKLRIFNPDGSEAEKSGNGLRIFSRYLWDHKLVGTESFSIETIGGTVQSRVHPGGRIIEVEMGRVSFMSDQIPVTGESREVINEKIKAAGREFTFCAATIGNPHCVIILEEISEKLAREAGPVIEMDSRFPNRINVQFMKVTNRNCIQIEIWERGAGYTLASGSSSSAAAAVAYKLGLCDREITVEMPGGELEISLSPEFDVLMLGPVTRVAEGILFKELFSTSS